MKIILSDRKRKSLYKWILSGVLGLFVYPISAQSKVPVYQDNKKSTEERVNDLCRRMTLDEKADFLTGADSWHFKGIGRLGIPSIQVTDCGHGVTVILDKNGNWVGNATCFPTAVGQAATWNRSLIQEMGSALGREVRATGSSILLAPMVNIKRHPLNGRNYETFSEDPLLTGEMAAAFIKGVQSEHIGAVIKGMTANNQQTDQHDLLVQMNERTLQEIYLPNFRIPISKAHPWGVMTAYNGLNGVPTSESRHLLQEILKDTWKYEGFVVSDWGAVKSTRSISTGLDLEMPGPGKFLIKDNVLKAIDDKTLTIAQLDDKVKRILRALIKTRLMDKNPPILHSELNSEKHQLLARKVSEEGIVLLKNQGNVLPLKQSLKRLAVIGPNATQARLGGGGSASVSPFYSVSPLEGLKKICGSNTEIVFEEGCGLNGNLKLIDGKYLTSAGDGKTVAGLKAEYFSNAALKGQPVVTSVDPIVHFSWGWTNPKPEIGKWGYSVRWSGRLTPPVSGDYRIGLSASECGYRLYINNKLVIDEWEKTSKDNFEASFTSGNKSIPIALKANVPIDIRIEFFKQGQRNSIRLEWEMPGENPIDKAREVAKNCDAVIIYAGLSNFFEGGNNDRPDILLPGEQNNLIREVAKVNPNTVVVLINGSPVGMPWIDDVNAVLEAYYPGQEGGNAIAGVLFGKINPSGKLPETFPVNLSDNPAYTNYQSKDHTVDYAEGIYVGYRHYDARNIEPLFPFGYGLSYTTFEYSNLRLTKKGQSLIAGFNIKNTGKVAGAEVAQLYIHDLVSSVDRPLKELKNFEKVFLKAGETKTVTFTITDKDLSFYSEKQNKWVVEPGQFEVQIGSSSRNIRLKKIFTR